MSKETSKEVARIAGKILGMPIEELHAWLDNADADQLINFAEEIRVLAASCLSQAEPDAGD